MFALPVLAEVIKPSLVVLLQTAVALVSSLVSYLAFQVHFALDSVRGVYSEPFAIGYDSCFFL